jgi:hypothetical protein
MPFRMLKISDVGAFPYYRLFPIKHKHVAGLALARRAHGNRQGLEIWRKLDLPGVRNLTSDFACDFQIPIRLTAWLAT